MANKIKETPILTSKDAEHFRKLMERVVKISPDERDRILNTYNKFKPLIYKHVEQEAKELWQKYSTEGYMSREDFELLIKDLINKI